MKKYFQYKFDANVKNRLISYYENINLDQHSKSQILKSNLKLERIYKLTNFDNNDVVLDIGCSSGYLLKKISSLINKGLGIDISKSIIDSNNKINFISNISFKNFDGNFVDLNEKYNKIFLIDVLEHSFYPNRLIDIVKEYIKEDGLLLIEVPFTGFLSEIIFGDYHQGHLRYYDPKYLSEYIQKSGFEIENIHTYNSVPMANKFIKYPLLFNIMNFLINLIPSAIYPYFGEILVTAKLKK
jgi:2-polyprenyl-3-methyl-5-hydroxy-6-metoxy-1,4-benzoquinol methylase